MVNLVERRLCGGSRNGPRSAKVDKGCTRESAAQGWSFQSLVPPRVTPRSNSTITLSLSLSLFSLPSSLSSWLLTWSVLRSFASVLEVYVARESPFPRKCAQARTRYKRRSRVDSSRVESRLQTPLSSSRALIELGQSYRKQGLRRGRERFGPRWLAPVRRGMRV